MGLLQLPTRRRTAVPASWTDRDARFSRKEDQPEILLGGLLELARYCHGLRTDRSKRRPSRRRSGSET